MQACLVLARAGYGPATTWMERPLSELARWLRAAALSLKTG